MNPPRMPRPTRPGSAVTEHSNLIRLDETESAPAPVSAVSHVIHSHHPVVQEPETVSQWPAVAAIIITVLSLLIGGAFAIAKAGGVL